MCVVGVVVYVVCVCLVCVVFVRCVLGCVLVCGACVGVRGCVVCVLV